MTTPPLLHPLASGIRDDEDLMASGRRELT
jgi:hypothetical protein